TASVPTPTAPTAPTISRVSADPLPDGSVSLVWTTDQATDAQVIYGRASGALMQTRFGSGRGTRHWVLLSQMAPGRRYYYAVISRNGAGREVRSTIRSFEVPQFGVADSRQAQWRTGKYRSGMLIVTSDGGGLTLSSGRTSGHYRSRVLDARQMVTWRIARWMARVPRGANMLIRVRTGSTSTPDDSWTRWVQIDTSGQRVPGAVRPSRYLQYRVQMTAGRGGRPLLHSIGFTTSGRRPASRNETG
ncbi:MAG: fibronectin type III domain-containing protein, partial [Catenulispora sp.]